MFTRNLISAVCIFQMSLAPFAFADGSKDGATNTCTSEQDGLGTNGDCGGWDRSKTIKAFNKHVLATLRKDSLWKRAVKEQNIEIMCKMYARFEECSHDIRDHEWRSRIDNLFTEAAPPCPNGNCPVEPDRSVPPPIPPEVVVAPPPPPPLPAPAPVPEVRERIVYRDPPPPLDDSSGRKTGTGDFFSNPAAGLGVGLMAGLLLGKILGGGQQGGYPGYQPSPFGLQPLGAPGQGGFFGAPQLPNVYRAPGGPFGNMYGLGSGGLGQPGYGQIPSFTSYGGGLGYGGYSGYNGGLAGGGLSGVGYGGFNGAGYNTGAGNIYNGGTFGATYPVTGPPPTILPYR